MILFHYTPKNPAFLAMIENNIENYHKSYFEGILDEGYQNAIVRPYKERLKIYLVCEPVTKDNGSVYYRNPLAVVAFSESEAIEFYSEWTSCYGSVMTTLENDASKAQVDPPE